jgi:DNA-binding NarL/FixJ family response regulator
MSQRIRLVIVDDSARTRAGLCALLATWPEVEVVGEAMNGQEAVRLVEERQPAIVLMDLQMPIMDGVQATHLIKQRWPDVSVIVVTMYAADQADALAAGADAFIVKGNGPEPLLATLRAICELRKA